MYEEDEEADTVLEREERDERDENRDVVEELRVDSDMQRDKDDYDEAEREEEMKEEPKCWLRTISRGSISCRLMPSGGQGKAPEKLK